MSETASNVVTYTPLESGDGESRWIRLEQTQAYLPAPTVSEVADAIDRLYNIDPCEQGLGGGGEEAGEGPSAEEVDEELSVILERNGQCRQGWWLAAMNVYRTHRSPEYELRSETAQVESVEPASGAYRQEVEVNGPQIALDMPYAGNLQGIPAGVNWEVRGATVNLDRPVHDRLILRYNTWYERVNLRVPTRKTDDGEEYEPAAVVAFWGDLAAECELEPPEEEDEEDRAAKEDLCGQPGGHDEPGEGGCFKTIHHYWRCACSGRKTDEWDEVVGASCDGAEPGSMVGFEERYENVKWCEGEEDEDLSDPEYFKRRCCKAPHRPLPTPMCRESRKIYRGGRGIEGGGAHWMNLYGPNTRIIAVMPESGICGEEITLWNVPQRNCCDDITPLSAAEDNPKTLQPGLTYMIRVEDGKPGELDWQASGGLTFDATGGTSYRTANRGVNVTVDENACPHPTITVDDGCDPVEIQFDAPGSEGPQVEPTDILAGSKIRVVVHAYGGVPPYMWQASGGLRIESWSESSVSVITPEDPMSWCVEEVTVIDQCGNEATCTVRNGETGRWRAVANFDRANPPGAPFPYTGPGMSTEPSGGYYATARFWGCQGRGCCSTGGTPYGLPVGTNILQTPVIVGGADAGKTWAQDCADVSGGAAHLSGGCCGPWAPDPRYPTEKSYIVYAYELFQWVCA